MHNSKNIGTNERRSGSCGLADNTLCNLEDVKKTCHTHTHTHTVLVGELFKMKTVEKVYMEKWCQGECRDMHVSTC